MLTFSGIITLIYFSIVLMLLSSYDGHASSYHRRDVSSDMMLPNIGYLMSIILMFAVESRNGGFRRNIWEH